MIDSTTRIEPVSVVRQSGGKAVRSVTLHALAAALMYASPLVLFVPAAFISSALRNGRKAIWGTIAIAAGIVLAATVVAGIAPMSNASLVLVLRLIFEIGIPSVAVTLALRRGLPLGQAILIGVGVSAVGFLVTELTMREGFHYSAYDSAVANFRVNSEGTLQLYRSWGWPEEQLREMGRFTRTVAESFMPFVFVAVSVLMFLMSMIMIPRLPSGRFTGDAYLFRNLSWPDSLLFGFVLSGAAPLVKGPGRAVLLNILAVVVLLYLLQGLAIFRTLVLRMGLGFFGSAIAYALLGLLTFYVIAPFALFLAGLFDPFFDFRNLKRKGETDESDSD